MRETTRLGLALLWLGLAAACDGAAPATEVVVAVRSDLEAGRDLDTLEVRLLQPADDGNEAAPTHTFPLAEQSRQGAFALPLSFSLAPAGDPDARFRLVVTGLLDGEAVVERQVRASFRKGHSLLLEVFLAARCQGELCRDDGQRRARTCDPGAPAEQPDPCEAIPSLDPLPEWGGPGTELMGGDAGMDAEAGSDAQQDAMADPLTEVAIASAGEACATEGERACDGPASRGKLLCDQGVWRTNGGCDGDTRCQTVLGEDQGVCLPMPAPCVDATPETSFCLAPDRAGLCGRDLLDLTELACGEDQLCGDSGACEHVDDCAGDPCNGHGQCQDGALEFTCFCEGLWGTSTCEVQVPLPLIRDMTLDATGNVAYLVDELLRAVIAIDVETGNRSVLSDDEDETNGLVQVGDGPRLDEPAAIAVDPEGGFAYVVDFGNKSVVSVALDGGHRVVKSDAEDETDGDKQVGTGPGFRGPTDIALAASDGLAYVLDGTLAALLSVDLRTGDRTVVSDKEDTTGGIVEKGAGPGFSNPLALALDVVNGFAYVADPDLDAIFEVNLTNGRRRIISDAEDTTNGGAEVGEGVGFESPAALAYDAAGGRLLVADASLEAVIAVDLPSGDRTVLSDHEVDTGAVPRVGSGPGFQWPVAIEMDASGARALVMDRRVAALFTVDLGNGNRSFVSQGANPGAPLAFPEYAVVDAANNRSFLVDGSLRALLSIDLTTGALTVVSDASNSLDDNAAVGGGPAFSSPASVALDMTNDIAYVVDDGLDALLRVNLSTGQRTVISDDNDTTDSNKQVGAGPGFSLPGGIDLDLVGGKAYIVDRSSSRDALFSVDLSTGLRTVISDDDDETDGNKTVGSGPGLANPLDVRVDVAKGIAYIVDVSLGALVAVDLETGNRTILSDDNDTTDGNVQKGTGPALQNLGGLDLDRDAGVAYISVGGGLYAVNLETGNRTRISDDEDSGPGDQRIGIGISLNEPKSVSLGADGFAYVLLSRWDWLAAVNLENGNRALVPL